MKNEQIKIIPKKKPKKLNSNISITEKQFKTPNCKAKPKLKYSLNFQIKRLDSKKKKKYFSLKDPIEDFKELGSGVFFYFYFIKFFTIVFFIITLISLIPIVKNINGKGLKFHSDLNPLLSTTLGNTQKIQVKKIEMAKLKQMKPKERNDFIHVLNKPIHDILVYHEICDIFIILFFFFSIYFFQFNVQRHIEEIDEKRLSLKRFSILVKDLPRKNLDKKKVEEFFSNFGEVKKIAFAFKYNNSLKNLKKIAEYKQKLKDLKERQISSSDKEVTKILKKLKKHIKKVNRKLSIKKLNINNYSNFEVIYVFITFNSESTPSEIIKKFKNAYSSSIKQKLLCQKPKKCKKFFYNAQKLKISRPDHPKNIIHENIEFTKKYRIKKILKYFIIWISVLILFFLINLILTAYTESSEQIQCSHTEITSEEIEEEIDGKLISN